MSAQTLHKEQKDPQYVVNPKKFVIWMIIISIVMLFAGLTSGYIVRRAEGNWLFFELPSMFYYTTGIILLSSITLLWAGYAARKDEMGQLKIAVGSTFLLGVAFIAGQFMGWKQMVQQGIFFAGDDSNPAGSFVYALSWLHVIHVLAGLIFLLVVFINTFRYKVHSRNINQLKHCSIYWHFVDLLWIYLFFFLLLNR